MEFVGSEKGSMEGSHLLFLYGQLISHLAGSLLEPTNAYEYIDKEFVARKSSVIWADQ